MHTSTLTVAVALAVGVLAACSDPSGPPQPKAPVQTWPIVYNLSDLEGSYRPGTVYTKAGYCGVQLRSSLESGTLTLQQNGSFTMALELWYQGHSSHNVLGIPCPSVNTYHSKPAESGTYTITGTRGNRTVNLLFTKSGGIGTAPAGESGFPVLLSTALPGYNVFGSGNPYTPLRASVWNKK